VVRAALVATSLLVVAPVRVLAQDAAAGEKDFLVCRACHQIGPNAKNAVGPVLNGVIGRTAGTYPDYTYSEANKGSGLVWTPDELDKYLTSPQTVVPHTKMIFPGLKDEQKRKDVIAYLSKFALDGQTKQ
jgi:cytochrome c